MAIARSCNRCDAPVDKPLDPTPRAVVVPASSPSTNPVAADMDCQIGIVTGAIADEEIDYCGPCLLSVLLARAIPTADLQAAKTAVETIAAAREAVASVVLPAEAAVEAVAPEQVAG